MSVLLEQGHSQSAVARLPGVSEGKLRYHRKRMGGGASRQSAGSIWPSGMTGSAGDMAGPAA